jgi:endonuclease/exonuclease/phosphatase (EEP) superfamily protein YafD
MREKLKKRFSNLLFIANIACVVMLLVGDIAPISNPQRFWPIALMGIGFPILALFTALFGVAWIFIRRKRSLLSLGGLILSIPGLLATFALNVPTSFNNVKDASNLRVLTWNVGLMNYTELDTNRAIAKNAVIFSKIKESDADVVCLQEFFSSIITGNYYNIIDSMKTMMNYPYHYFSRDNPKFDNKFFNGTIIFSRYPIVDTAKVVYPLPFIGSVIRAGIIVNNDTVDIFSTRFQSVNFTSNEYQELHNIKKGDDKGFAGSKNIIRKLRVGYDNRTTQMEMVKKLMSASRRPQVLTGDFNDVPVGFVYHQMKAGLSDCWEDKGFGLGRTFKFIYPTLRIDHILFNNAFATVQATRIMSGDETDHNGVLADLQLIKKGNSF